MDVETVQENHEPHTIEDDLEKHQLPLFIPSKYQFSYSSSEEKLILKEKEESKEESKEEETELLKREELYLKTIARDFMEEKLKSFLTRNYYHTDEQLIHKCKEPLIVDESKVLKKFVDHLNKNIWVDYIFNIKQFYILEKVTDKYVIHFREIDDFCEKIYGYFPYKIRTLETIVHSSKGILTYYIPNILWVGIYLKKKNN